MFKQVNELFAEIKELKRDDQNSILDHIQTQCTKLQKKNKLSDIKYVQLSNAKYIAKELKNETLTKFVKKLVVNDYTCDSADYLVYRNMTISIGQKLKLGFNITGDETSHDVYVLYITTKNHENEIETEYVEAKDFDKEIWNEVHEDLNLTDVSKKTLSIFIRELFKSMIYGASYQKSKTFGK